MKLTPTRFAVFNREEDGLLQTEFGKPYTLTPVVMEGENGEEGLAAQPDINHLLKVYIELTNRCNLECRTCIRNVWDEPLGLMQWEVFTAILKGMEEFSPLPTIFLGGFGEPLVHPRLIEMIHAVKEIGGFVELITNGILLTADLSKQLVETGLDVLWISIDGITAESYADVRLGASLPEVLANLDALLNCREAAQLTKPQVGIACVAMRRNIHEIPELIRLGMDKGIDLFSISNVLAYTPELLDEVMYERTLIKTAHPSGKKVHGNQAQGMGNSNLPIEDFQKALCTDFRFQVAGSLEKSPINQCPFIRKGSTSIRWDGELSPCLPLLHTYDSFIGKRLRRSTAFSYGNITHHSLADLWNGPQYVALRKRLQAFSFSPCTFCNSCEMADGNQEDCFGNSAPACGGCLWAQGLIQCP